MSNLETNAGYVIVDKIVVNNAEIVLGKAADGRCVTWERNIKNDLNSNEKNYFWGHYFGEGQDKSAVEDFLSRAEQELSVAKSSIKEKYNIREDYENLCCENTNKELLQSEIENEK